jgi:hypothetical protein
MPEVVESLPGKCETLSSKSSTFKKIFSVPYKCLHLRDERYFFFKTNLFVKQWEIPEDRNRK